MEEAHLLWGQKIHEIACSKTRGVKTCGHGSVKRKGHKCERLNALSVKGLS